MKVLVIDDEKSIRLSLKIGLEKLNLEVFVAESGEEGLEIYKRERPDLIIVDINLPGINGIEVLSRLKRIDRDVIVIMITYMTDVKLAVEAMKLGAHDYFTKPFNLGEIKESIKKTLDFIKVKSSIGEDENNFFVGSSPKIEKIKDLIKDICSLSYDTSILITGESGTGKEVVAKSIQACEKNKDRPFVAINCAAIPKNLQESELFGYEKGAFSDAKADKIGLIEKANGGILFFDEIGDMEIGLQAKVLRVIQEKKYRRIGGTKEYDFSATFLSATNKDLLREVEKEEFRKDLYYRINIIPVYIPPLRERREDIPLLIEYFIDEYNKKLNKDINMVDSEAMNMLINYDWPGNIRELKNLMERVMIFKKDNLITLEDLPEELLNNEEDDGGFSGENISLEEIEKIGIMKALEANNWNISRTSKELEISRQTLRAKINKYSIEKP